MSNAGSNGDTWQVTVAFLHAFLFHLSILRWLKTSAAQWNLEGFWQHQWRHTSRASSCRAFLLPAVPVHTSNLFSCTQAKFCSIPQCTLRSWLFFSSLWFFFSSLSPPSIWSTSEHLPRVSGNPGSGRWLCGCNFYPAQLWDLIRAHTSAQEWVNAPTYICLIITRDVIRIIHVMTTRGIGSWAQRQPKSPTDFGNAWI